MIRWETFRCGGAGGQNVNKLESGARGYYKDLVSESRVHRSQSKNKQEVVSKLRAMYEGGITNDATAVQNKSRKSQVGSGQRGDKIRTYREKDDTVKDDRTGDKVSYSQLKRGNFGKLKW